MREKDLHRFYEALKTKSQRASDQTVHIFVSSNDVDSLAACRIITHILNSDSIKYTIIPAVGYDTIIKHRSDVEEDDQAYTAIFVNCGGTEDVAKKLKAGKQTSFFIVDSHRPIHLQNLNQHNDRVMVLLDKDESTDDIDKMADLNDDDLSKLESLYETDDEGSDYDDRPAKRPKSDYEDVVRKLKADREAHHIQGSSYAIAAGVLMYRIADLLRKDTRELLWYACVALTDQLVHLRINAQTYEAGYQELENQVATGNTQAPQEVILEDGTSVCEPENFRIQCQEEPRLLLVSEWTLYDSMLRSLYTATTLKTWEEAGEGRMKQLLARMGIPLKECRQRYLQMSLDVKRRLKEEFDRYSTDYVLSELYYKGFQFSHGYKIRISASDVVSSVTALLEDWEDEETSWADNFWHAVTAMRPTEHEQLHKGFELAIAVNVAIFRQASLLLAKKDGINMAAGKLFYFAKLNDLADTELLQHPMALSKLIHFLLEAGYRNGWKKGRVWAERPMVIAAASPNNPLALIVAVSHRPRIEVAAGNKFGYYFDKVASKMKFDHQHDGFESSWIRIDNSQVDNFFYRLAEGMATL